MGFAIQFESHRNELPFAYLIDHDPDVQELYSQPVRGTREHLQGLYDDFRFVSLASAPRKTAKVSFCVLPSGWRGASSSVESVCSVCSSCPRTRASICSCSFWERSGC